MHTPAMQSRIRQHSLVLHSTKHMCWLATKASADQAVMAMLQLMHNRLSGSAAELLQQQDKLERLVKLAN